MRRSGIDRFFLVAGLAACVLAVAVAAQAGVLGPTIVVAEPAEASPLEDVVIYLAGESSDGCTPKDPAVAVDGNSITVTLVHPGLLPCTQVPRLWDVDVNLGHLPVGTYVVTARTVAYPPPLPPHKVTVLGQTSFTVVDSVAGRAGGATPRRAVCWNRTTGQRVAVRTDGASVNCERAGLIVTPGDKVSIRMAGTVN